uniref:Uncharacterized protein n=1 Tax=Timema tahoe TaxID=61484 RepID=A0A7R9NV87_9NEOP|nr:unnamed protein product [Timema tahoe]
MNILREREKKFYEFIEINFVRASSRKSPPVNGSAVKPVPPPRDHLRIEKDGRLVNRAPGPQVPARYANITTLNNNTATDQSREPTKEQLDSIRKFQFDLDLAEYVGTIVGVQLSALWKEAPRCLPPLPTPSYPLDSVASDVTRSYGLAKGYIIWSGIFSKLSPVSCELSVSTKEVMGLL